MVLHCIPLYGQLGETVSKLLLMHITFFSNKLSTISNYTPAQIAEIAKNPRSNEYKKISAYIARMEHFCVGVNQKIYDKKTVYALAHDYLDGGIKSRIEPIISRKNQYKDSDYYENIHQFYNWIEKRNNKL